LLLLLELPSAEVCAISLVRLKVSNCCPEGVKSTSSFALVLADSSFVSDIDSDKAVIAAFAATAALRSGGQFDESELECQLTRVESEWLTRAHLRTRW
jgi:hypothetical protein